MAQRLVLCIAFAILPLSIFAIKNVGNAEETLNTQSPIVLELFTSQSCSSCPPADKILGELAANNQNIIAMSCHVTYWNHLHWKDTLSSEYCTKRQRDYATSLKSRRVYTPQIILNGTYEMVGSRKHAIENAMRKAAPIKNITMQRVEGVNIIKTQNREITRADNKYIFDLPQLKSGEYYPILSAYRETHTQDIPKGENSGRTVTYTNPVIMALNFDTWNGTAKTLTYDAIDLPAAAGFFLSVHQGSPTGEIVAAGQLNMVAY